MVSAADIKKNENTEILKKGNKIYATSESILNMLVGGLLIAVAFTNPVGGAKILESLILKSLDKAWEKYDQRRLKQSIKRMVDRRLLEVKQVGQETVVVVSEKGKRQLLRYNFNKMELKKPTAWDGKWRIVIFDVGENKKVFRDSLRRKIKTLGLFQLQESVFVTPYPCGDQIAFLRQYFGIGDEVSYFTAIELEEEDFLRKKFNL